MTITVHIFKGGFLAEEGENYTKAGLEFKKKTNKGLEKLVINSENPQISHQIKNIINNVYDACHKLIILSPSFQQSTGLRFNFLKSQLSV